jgi:hypothetical protein
MLDLTGQVRHALVIENGYFLPRTNVDRYIVPEHQGFRMPTLSNLGAILKPVKLFVHDLWLLLGLACFAPFFQQPRYERGPACLVACAQALPRIAVEIFIEELQVAPVGIVPENLGRALPGPTPFFVGKEDAQQTPA